MNETAVQNAASPFDGLTANANPCGACPTKLPPEWRVHGGEIPQFCLCCGMCGRQTNWIGDWKGLLDWWNTNNPALPDGTKFSAHQITLASTDDILRAHGQGQGQLESQTAHNSREMNGNHGTKSVTK